MSPILAQATQPVTGMATWGPAEWTVFGTVLAGVFSSIAAAIVSIIKAARAQSDAAAAQAATNVNSTRITNTSLHAQNIDGKLTTLAQDVGKLQGNADPGPLRVQT